MTFSSGVQFQLLAPPLSVSFAVSAVSNNLRLHTLPATNLIKASPRKPTKLELAPDPNFEISIWVQILILKSQTGFRFEFSQNFFREISSLGNIQTSG